MPGGFALLLCFQLLGEVVAHGLGLPVPGPVVGMVLLFGTLLARYRDGRDPPARVSGIADALLAQFGLLFVPAGVGVVLYLPLLAQNWVPVFLAVVVGTLLTVAFTGLGAQALLRLGWPVRR